MATYEEIYGKRVKEFDSDPTLDSSYEGQVWYDKATGTLRTVTASIAAWASTGPLISARSSGAGFGVPTAAVYAGGGPGANANTFEYNGSGWNTGGSLNTGRGELGGTTAGTETAGLCYGSHTAPPGFNISATCEEYDGTSWTNGNNMATSVSFEGGSGIQTAAFSAGGRVPGFSNNSQEYDGTNWSNGNNINTARQALAGMGTQTAGIIAGGESSSGGVTSSETYDGTNFTAGPNMGTARYRLAGSGSDSTACLVFGGRFNPPAADKAQTEAFDGTSWSEKGDLATARQQLSGNRGTSSSAIAAGGLPPPASATADTEEFTQSINTITAAAWSSGGNINEARRAFGSCGSNTAGLIFGGRLSPTASPPAGYRGQTEQYDGTSWTEVSDLNNTRSNVAGAGTQAAAVAFGGLNPSLGPRPADNVEEWDGSSWTNVTDVPTGSENYGSCGIQTAALQYGGSAPPGVLTTTLEYDGTNWTSGGAMNTARKLYNGSGTQTAALGAGGQEPSLSSKTEEYDGTSWSEVNNMNRAAFYSCSTSAPQTDSMSFGSGPSVNYVEKYDGTIWSTAPTLATSRSDGSGFGTSANGSVMVGGPSGPTTYPSATEEFTGVTETVTASTLTSS